MMDAPSDHLLRTFAAVPQGSAVLDLGCGDGRHTLPLLQLGFDVYACDAAEHAVTAARSATAGLLSPDDAARRITPVPHFGALGYPDAFFDWVVAYDALSGVGARDEMVDVLREARRVLKPGGWIYVAVRALDPDFNPLSGAADYASDSAPEFSFTEDTLTALMEDAGLALAERAHTAPGTPPHLEAIYRRADVGTPV